MLSSIYDYNSQSPRQLEFNLFSYNPVQHGTLQHTKPTIRTLHWNEMLTNLIKIKL